MDAQIIEDARRFMNSITFRMSAKDVKYLNLVLQRQMEIYRVNSLDSLQIFLKLRDKLPIFLAEMVESGGDMTHWKRMLKVVYIADYLQLYDTINASRTDM